MKVKGTEALNLSPVRVQEAKTDTKENLNAVQASTVTENKNISQITEFERNELPVSEKVVIAAIEKANKAISGSNRKFVISVHEKTKEVMVKVLDSETNEVIRELPPEKILDLVAKLMEMAGLIVDERR